MRRLSRTGHTLPPGAQGHEETPRSGLRRVARIVWLASALGMASCALHHSGPDLTIPGDPPLRYVTVGSGPALIVVLHGGPGLTHDYLRPEWDRLASVGQVVYYDQRGCGANPSSGELTWQVHVADLDRLIRRLREGRKVFLAGSSWGAELALRYAYSHPAGVDALVLSGFVGWPAPEGVARMVAPLPLVKLDTPKVADHIPSSLFGTRWTSPDSAVLESQIEAYIRRSVKEYGTVHVRRAGIPGNRSERVYALQPSAVGGDSAFAWRFPMDCVESGLRTSLSRRGPPLAALFSIRTPTLVVSGGQGFRSDGSIQLVGVLPQLTVRSIADGGHDPWHSRPDVFFRIVSSFLRKRLD